MEQIRNISFAVLNQSTLSERVFLNEKRSVNLYDTCVTLDEKDKENCEEYTDMHQ